MAYRDFDLARLEKLGLVLAANSPLFQNVMPHPISSTTLEVLARNVPLAISMGSEKARSEFIVAPILSELVSQCKRPFSMFSGIILNADPAKGLTGECDFLISLSPVQLEIKTPILAIVEAKRDDVTNGLWQCAASMLASREFNTQRQTTSPIVYGCVTTGTDWRFLQLVNNELTVDSNQYYITQPDRILGILLHMIEQYPSA